MAQQERKGGTQGGQESQRGQQGQQGQGQDQQNPGGRGESNPSQGGAPRDPMEFPRKPNEPSRGEPRAKKDESQTDVDTDDMGGSDDDNR